MLSSPMPLPSQIFDRAHWRGRMVWCEGRVLCLCKYNCIELQLPLGLSYQVLLLQIPTFDMDVCPHTSPCLLLKLQGRLKGRLQHVKGGWGAKGRAGMRGEGPR